MTMRVDGHGPVLNMPSLPATSTPAADTPFVATKESPRFRPTDLTGTTGPAQATEGVTMLKDPKLSFWPPFLSGKRYKDVDELPLNAECGDTFDKPSWVPHVRQGALGDCWFMGTLAAMALAGDSQYHPAIRRLDDEHVAVKFGTREFGLEDDLPFNRQGKLLYARQNLPHFEATWPIYYEKAAASLMGGYKALDGGWPQEAFELLLGTDVKDVERPADIVGYVRGALDAGLPVAMTTRSQQTELMEELGVHSNHTYAVRKVLTLNEVGEPTLLGVKLWNPWGHEHPNVLTPQQLETMFDSVTTPKETFGWGVH